MTVLSLIKKIAVASLRSQKITAVSSTDTPGSAAPSRLSAATVIPFDATQGATSSSTLAPAFASTTARVLVSRCGFRRWWIFIVAMHSLCGVFLCYAGMLYKYLEGSSVMVDFTIYSITVDNKYFNAIAWMYFGLAGIHGLLILHLVVRSIQARGLVFYKPKVKPASLRKLSDSRESSRNATNTTLRATHTTTSLWNYVHWRPPLWIIYVWRSVRAFFAVFDVRHKNYGLVFLLREIVLTFLQSVQTYRLSCLVSRLWMNNVMASLLVLNCWATPLLQYAFRSRVGHVRLGGAIVNLLLDMVSYIVLPTALLYPYIEHFNQDLKNFNRIFWFIDASLISLINEVQLTFVGSLYDALSKCVIALSVARGLHSITKLICIADSIVPATVASSNPAAGEVSVERPRLTRTLTSIDLSSPRALWWRMKIESAGHRLLFLWGLIVLIAHVYASWLPTYKQCRLPTRPWFGTKPSCSLLEINCAVERTSGSADDIDRILRSFDPDRIEYLVIRNCPLLQLPSRTQTLNQLFGLKLVSSTILDWDEHAALTTTHHPTLRFLFIIDVKMRELPIGLRSPDFPQSLRDIEMSRTNLSVVPDDLDMIWPQGMFMALEECQLQEIPPVLLRMHPQDLALGMNNISKVPRELLEELPVRLLLLDGNPIDLASFPSTLARPPRVVMFGLVRTGVEALPEWMDENVLASSYVVLGETPFCDQLIAANQASKEDLRTLMGIMGIDCSLAFFDSGTLNWFPIDDEAVVNPSYSLA